MHDLCSWYKQRQEQRSVSGGLYTNLVKNNISILRGLLGLSLSVAFFVLLVEDGPPWVLYHQLHPPPPLFPRSSLSHGVACLHWPLLSLSDMILHISMSPETLLASCCTGLISLRLSWQKKITVMWFLLDWWPEWSHLYHKDLKWIFYFFLPV